MLSGSVLSRGSEKETIPCLCRLLGVAGILVVPWLWARSSSLCFCLHANFSAFLCVPFCLLCRTLSSDVPPPKLMCSHLDCKLSTSASPYFPVSSHSEVLDTPADCVQLPVPRPRPTPFNSGPLGWDQVSGPFQRFPPDSDVQSHLRSSLRSWQAEGVFF